MLNMVFWVASASDLGDELKSDLLERSNLPDPITSSFSETWVSALKADCILNSPVLAGKLLFLLHQIRAHTHPLYRNDDRHNAR